MTSGVLFARPFQIVVLSLLCASLCWKCAAGSDAVAAPSLPSFNWPKATAINPALGMYGAQWSAPSASTARGETFLTSLSSNGNDVFYSVYSESAWSSGQILPYQSLGPITNHQYGYGGAGTATQNSEVYISWTTPNNNDIQFNHIAYMTWVDGGFSNPSEFASGSQYQPGVGGDGSNNGDVFIYHTGNEGSGCLYVEITAEGSVNQGYCAQATNFNNGLATAYFNGRLAQFTAYVGSDGFIYYINGNTATKTSYNVDSDSALSIIEYQYSGYDVLVVFYKYSGVINYFYVTTSLITYPQSSNKGYSTTYACPIGGAGALFNTTNGGISVFFQQNTEDNLVYLGQGTLITN